MSARAIFSLSVLALVAAHTVRAGAPDAAARARDSILAPYHALDDAKGALAKKDHAAARAALMLVDAGSPGAGKSERTRLALERAQLALALETDPKARLSLADVLVAEARTRAHGRAVRAAAFRALSRERDALAEERRLLSEDVASLHARALESTLENGVTTLSPDEWRMRLDALVATGRLARAAREAAFLSVDVRTHDVPILSAAVRAHVRGRDTAGALALLERVSVDPGARSRIVSTPTGLDTVHDLTAWTLGKAMRIDDAVARYDLLASTTKDAARAGDACFLAAFLRYEEDALDDARARFRTCLESGQIGSREVPLRWYLALSSWHAGARDVALREVTTLVQRFPRDREARKHRFFRARFARLLDPAAQARTTRDLRALDDENPFDWYGMLARRELGLAPRAGVVVAHDALARRAPDDENARRAIALADAGFPLFARTVLADRGPTDAAAVALAARVGAHHFAWRRSSTVMPRSLVDGRGALVTNAGWRASYATPHRALVDGEAAKAGVPMSFVYAIMRTESGFDETALSVAGARGLLQLMPHTAMGIAEHTGYASYNSDHGNDDALFEPRVIIPLGAATLGLWSKETGSLLLAAASYNGAPDNVARWVARTHTLDVVEFVERIPFKETRDYVKSVLAAEAVYRALEGEPLSLALPESIAPLAKAPTVFSAAIGD